MAGVIIALETEGALTGSKPASPGPLWLPPFAQYLLPLVEAVSLYDRVHQAEVVAARGHGQGGFPLLQAEARREARFSTGGV